MKNFDRSQVTETHEEILRKRLGEIYDWEKPNIVPTVGPYAPEIFEEYERSLDSLLTECFQVLRGASDTEIEAIQSTEVREETGVRQAWRAVRSAEINSLVKRKPHWAAGGFGHPDYVADFEYWARMPSLSLDEAVSLSVGIEPKYLKDDLDEIDAILELTAPPLLFAKRRAEQFRRQFHIHRVNRKIQSVELLDWVKSVELDVHVDALNALERFHGSKAATPVIAKRPDKRELDSVASLFTAMAIEQFGYDPTAARSPTVKEIQDLAASLGISMSDDTIRNYLRHGAKFIDPHWKPHER